MLGDDEKDLREDLRGLPLARRTGWDEERDTGSDEEVNGGAVGDSGDSRGNGTAVVGVRRTVGRLFAKKSF
jgi:hypothetical protein